jgi:ATP adenylyltransferase
MPSELVHTYQLLLSARKAGRKFFAFYNCERLLDNQPRFIHSKSGGENSGASQAHKHIQFVPLADESGPPIEHLARKAQLEFAGKFSQFFCAYNWFVHNPH